MLKKENKVSNEHLEILLEDMNSQFKGLKEGNQFLSEQVERLNGKFDKLDEKVDRNHQEFVEFKDETKSNFQTVFKLLSNIDDDIKGIKSEIIDIKSELTDIKKTLVNKVDFNVIAKLEERIKIVEMELLKLRAA